MRTMLPKTHIVFGIIFAVLLKLCFSLGFVEISIVFLSSVLIDVDHYVYYVLLKRDWSLKNSFQWFLDEAKRYDKLTKKQKKKNTLGIFPLHSIEIALLILLLSYYWNIFLFVFVGFCFHMAGDFVYELAYSKRALYRFSLTYSLLYKLP